MTNLKMTTPDPTHHYLRKVALRLLRAGGFIMLVFFCGFFIFAKLVTSGSEAFLVRADGIVALTGDEDRIAEAVKLLSEGRAKRLLISGVHRKTNKPELITLNAPEKQEARLFQCCIDLGKRAFNTEANAVEAAVWAKQRGYNSLIIVTSNYHMPRTLLELRQAMPSTLLIPYPVASSAIDPEWWSDEHSLRFLAKEYVKFTAALVRYAAFYIAGPFRDTSHDRTLDASLG